LTGPSSVRDQSTARIRSPISPPPCKTAAAGSISRALATCIDEDEN